MIGALELLEARAWHRLLDLWRLRPRQASVCVNRCLLLDLRLRLLDHILALFDRLLLLLHLLVLIDRTYVVEARAWHRPLDL